ncbi:MAG: UDP-N-acetylmuramate dehydrogenase [Ruminococcaceae bacterium]|nr:UDP-N-acetylmuramate dehydrogenase [Oscillospiraceae bacterium]
MRLIDYTLLLDALRDICPSLKLNEPMSSHTTFRVGGVAAMTVAPESIDELVSILTLHKEIAPSLPLCVLGKGSNVLFDDEGYDGLVIFTSELQNVSFSKPDEQDVTTITAECGVSLTLLARQCVAENRALRGLEFAFGIPGSIGGAVVMNAGAYGGEMSDVVFSVDYYDPAIEAVCTAEADALRFSYRHSLFSEHPDYVVLRATLVMAQDDRELIISEMSKNMTSRRLKQPLELPNAGSVFKRPEGHFAGKLIEDSGLKGYTIGGASVSEKHAGFIVNNGNATASDIKALIEHVRHVVKFNYGIELECEIKMISSN